ncbi:hypothetical protein [Microbacterium invictum]|uniref:Secreted protein n=1 Tax=Microbacterium invictum TaxID=515415 RepID=A0ABZ0VAE3_9MICO|nr:hypothetical protein [Microbacterium invictum]WQB70439.1 hypothetical protein T9R20_00330 [Microbacterium invictum]
MDWSNIWWFWWLIFPIGAALGGAVKSFDRLSERRHRRRLEMLHAKAELRAGTVPAVRSGRATAQDTGRETGADADAAASGSADTPLTRLLAIHDDVTARWLDYELDVAKLIAFPAMSDGRQPLTAAFLRAKRVADRLRPPSASARLSPEQLREYREAVTDYEVAFDLAERDARRVKDANFSAEERKRLDTAQQLLTVAIDEAATPAERQLAYRRVREELDGLLLLSDDAIEVLEKKVAHELPARPSTAPPPAAPPAAPPTPA